MQRLVSLCFGLLLFGIAIAQPLTPVLTPSYRPASGQTFPYRLLVNGEVQMETGGMVGSAHFAATVDLEQRWRQESNRMRCDLTIKGGSLRVFSSVGEQRQKLGQTTITFLTTPNGEILDVIGGGARSIEELVANFDLMAAGLAALLVPFPKEGVRVGDAWQAAHQLGATITLATVQCVEQPTNLSPRQQPLKLRLRYLLPIDALIDPSLRAQWNFTARYSAESEVLFSVVEGRTLSASGTIKLEVSGRIPLSTTQPSQPSQPQGEPATPEQESPQESPNQPSQEPVEKAPEPSPTPSVVPAFRLLVDARFDLVSAR